MPHRELGGLEGGQGRRGGYQSELKELRELGGDWRALRGPRGGGQRETEKKERKKEREERVRNKKGRRKEQSLCLCQREEREKSTLYRITGIC